MKNNCTILNKIFENLLRNIYSFNTEIVWPNTIQSIIFYDITKRLFESISLQCLARLFFQKWNILKKIRTFLNAINTALFCRTKFDFEAIKIASYEKTTPRNNVILQGAQNFLSAHCRSRLLNVRYKCVTRYYVRFWFSVPMCFSRERELPASDMEKISRCSKTSLSLALENVSLPPTENVIFPPAVHSRHIWSHRAISGFFGLGMLCHDFVKVLEEHVSNAVDRILERQQESLKIIRLLLTSILGIS